LVAQILDGCTSASTAWWSRWGIAADGQKHALGLWEGATENAAVCHSLLANLQSRGLRTDRSLLVILDGALALHKATRAVFGEAALIQRCQVHYADLRIMPIWLTEARSTATFLTTMSA
jgi:transposase-like protein